MLFRQHNKSIWYHINIIMLTVRQRQLCRWWFHCSCILVCEQVYASIQMQRNIGKAKNTRQHTFNEIVKTEKSMAKPESKQKREIERERKKSYGNIGLKNRFEWNKCIRHEVTWQIKFSFRFKQKNEELKIVCI